MTLVPYPARISGYPFPLYRDSYRYTTNLQPGALREETAAGAWGDTILHIGPDHETEVAERARILTDYPTRSASLPHMIPAQWDAMVYLMGLLAEEYPDDFSLESNNPEYRWVNNRTGASQSFIYGALDTLPSEPLDYITRQIAEDTVLLDEREGHLWADGGVVTFQAGWSFEFVMGMSFQALHGPVPRAVPDGVFSRAEQFLMRLQPGEVYRRLNWVMQGGRDMDVSLGAFNTWFPERATFADDVGADEFADRVFMRVELQHLIRLPTTGAILFLIGTRLLSLRDLAEVPEWRERMLAVIDELPDDMANYKGFGDIRQLIVDWLEERVNSSS